MTAEADQIGPARVSLPGIPAYLRSVYELGRRSIWPALPALAFLFLCLLGMGAYGALTSHSYAMGKGALGVKAAMNAAPLLFLVLMYIPFLPMQESLLRGHPIHFLLVIRRVLRERSIPSSFPSGSPRSWCCIARFDRGPTRGTPSPGLGRLNRF